jgi:glycosyltransferase involved in cell wall biosynthesis
VEDFGVSPWRTRVIPPGVDLDRFQPGDRATARERLGLPLDRRVLVTVRRLVPRMGIDVLLDALRDIDALLVVVGSGPSRSTLEAHAAKLGIRDRVVFAGDVEDDALPDYYRAADVAVLPSIALEGFGLAALEALACGTPVVGTDAGGLPELLLPLQSDLVVALRDASALCARLTAGLTSEAPFPDSATCRAYAERFNWDDVAATHVAAYERVVAGTRSTKRRVVYVDHTAQLSGAELALANLLPALADVDAHVVLGEDGPLRRRFVAEGISVEVLPLAVGARDLRRSRVSVRAVPLASIVVSLAYTLRLAVRLRRLQPDVVHTNSLKAALYGGVAARLAGIPVVWHLRDRIEEGELPRAAVRLVRALSRRIPAAVIGDTASTMSLIGGAARTFVVPSPIPPQAPGERSPAAELRVGMVGRLAPWKGQHVFVAAFARAFPNGTARALVIGAPLFGEDDYERDLHAQCRALGVESRVEFLGFRNDVPKLLQDLDILVHASTSPEPFGQVIVEGMAAGLPVVAAAAGGPLEIVDDGVDGFLFPPGDVTALAERLRLLAGDATLRDRVGVAARKTAAAYHPERVAARLTEVYDEVVPR